MEQNADKLMVIRALIELEDEKIMLEIKKLLLKHFSKLNNEAENIVQEPMTWTKYDQKVLEQSIAEAGRGEGTPHQEVMKGFREKYNR